MNIWRQRLASLEHICIYKYVWIYLIHLFYWNAFCLATIVDHLSSDVTQYMKKIFVRARWHWIIIHTSEWALGMFHCGLTEKKRYKKVKILLKAFDFARPYFLTRGSCSCRWTEHYNIPTSYSSAYNWQWSSAICLISNAPRVNAMRVDRSVVEFNCEHMLVVSGRSWPFLSLCAEMD